MRLGVSVLGILFVAVTHAESPHSGPPDASSGMRPLAPSALDGDCARAGGTASNTICWCGGQLMNPHDEAQYCQSGEAVNEGKKPAYEWDDAEDMGR